MKSKSVKQCWLAAVCAAAFPIGAILAATPDLQAVEAAIAQPLLPDWSPSQGQVSPQDKVEAITVETLDGWTIQTRFHWAGEGWWPVRYDLTQDQTVRETDQNPDGSQEDARHSPASTGSLPPSIPSDPNRPNDAFGSVGDSLNSSVRSGDWVFTFNYSFGVRDGELGWHIDSITLTFQPRPPGPGDELQR